MIPINRRGFIGSILGAVAWSKSKLKLLVSPAASAIQPTCCACGACWHETSGCPINITAMDGVAAIRFENVPMLRAEIFLAYHLPSQKFAEYGGQRVFPVLCDDHEIAIAHHFTHDYKGTCIAYAIPDRMVNDAEWPKPDSAQSIVRAI